MPLSRNSSKIQLALFVFLLDFGTLPTMWHDWFIHWTLELVRQCGIIRFSMGLWNCSDSVPLFVFLLDFGTLLTIRYYLFFYWILVLFRECGIIWFSIGLWNCSDSVALFLLYWTLELFRECGIICFSMRHWNCSDNVALLVFVLDFGDVPTLWRYLFLYGTLELFWQCGIICWINQSCHIVGRVPKSNRKTNNATWSEQFQSPIEKQIMP
jgi:hypothetical protein